MNVAEFLQFIHEALEADKISGDTELTVGLPSLINDKAGQLEVEDVTCLVIQHAIVNEYDSGLEDIEMVLSPADILDFYAEKRFVLRTNG